MRIEKRPKLAALLLATAITLSGCGGDSTGPKQRDEVALFGYLYVGESIVDSNAVYLTRTAGIEQYYDREDAAVTGATVSLRNEANGAVDTLRMVGPGLYANPAVTIHPRTTYTLTADIGGGEVITAITTTPPPFEILAAPREIPGEMEQASIPDSFPIILRCADPEQILIVDVYCLEDWRDAISIHPFGDDDRPNDYQEYGGDDGEPRHIFAYFRAKDIDHEGDLYRIGFYGDMMWFYGRQQVGVFAIDANYYNYVYRDHPELNGGVTGGIGVFGSACRRQYLVRAVR
jgi:hypothetical protein